MGGGCLPEATHSLGAFANAFPSIEALIEGLISLVEAQAVNPAELIFTAADYVVNLNWVPGMFGPLANQPWTCGLSFGIFAADSASSLNGWERGADLP